VPHQLKEATSRFPNEPLLAAHWAGMSAFAGEPEKALPWRQRVCELTPYGSDAFVQFRALVGHLT